MRQCCVGELLWDVLPGGRTLGGAPANVAYHLARLGRAATFVTRVGRDAHVATRSTQHFPRRDSAPQR